MRISLQRRESIHPTAENVARRHIGTPRRETVDLVGKEMLLYRCTTGKEADVVVAMDLPFVLYIPFGRGGEDANRKIPPASLSLGTSRTAETYYELVVTVQQGHTHQHKYSFPVPIQRFDTLSTFGMYNKPEYKTAMSDNIVTLGMSLPRWSYGPKDPITVYVRLAPNPDWMSKARKVTVDKLTITIEEEITFNPEGDEPTKKVNRLDKRVTNVKAKLSEAGYTTNMALVFPHRSIHDAEGIMRREKAGFPLYEVSSFTTTSTLYRIEFFLCIKVRTEERSCPGGGEGVIQIANSFAPGPPQLRARHSHTPAHRHLPHGPPGVQGGPGRHRAGRQGRVAGRPEPAAAEADRREGDG